MNELLLFYLCGLMLSAGISTPVTSRLYPKPHIYGILLWIILTSLSWVTVGVAIGHRHIDNKLSK